MRKLIAGAAGAAVAVAGLVALAGPAAAETGSTGFIIKPTTAYQWPSKDSSAVITGLAPGQEVTALCFTDDGDEVDGNEYWFRISETAKPDGNTGFVPKDAIGGVSRDGLPNCFPNES
jgi:hypothetical protein